MDDKMIRWKIPVGFSAHGKVSLPNCNFYSVTSFRLEMNCGKRWNEHKMCTFELGTQLDIFCVVCTESWQEHFS